MSPPSSPPLTARGAGGRGAALHDRTSCGSRLSQARPADLNLAHEDSLCRLSNIFGDEFSLEPFGGQVSPGSTITSSDRTTINHRSSTDGDRPAHTSPFGDSSEILPQEDALPLKTDSLKHRYGSSTMPDSITAPGVARAPSNASSVAHRISTSSRFSIPRAMSPYSGQTGPSHPYAMYPQTTSVARSVSLSSSTSTARPAPITTAAAAIDRNSQVSPIPPQHPYGMYYQNTVPEEAVDEPHLPPVLAPTPTTPQNSSIPLGFARPEPAVYPSGSRQGPNEVGDIIGPDGHTEQLPPYSRYPEALPPKRELSETVPTTPDTPRPPPNQALQDPESRTSSQTMISQPGGAPSHTETTTESESNGSFKEILALRPGKRACCGMPVWMFIIVGAVLILGTVIGGVIGGVLGSQRGAKDAESQPTATETAAKATVTVTASAVLDATPLSTSPGPLPAAPTGDFLMPAHALSGESNACVNKSSYADSWQCFSTGAFQYTVGTQGDANTLSLQSFQIDGTFIYGAQNPVLHKTNYTLKLMQDKTNMSLGPALFFFTDFDKLVIIAENNFPPINPVRRSVNGGELLRRAAPGTGSVAQPGHKPWFCWWNTTFLEAFIYINQNITDDLSPSPTSGFIEDPASTSGADETEYREPPDPDSSKRLKLYPWLVKIEEKRFVQHGPAPYCNQMQVMFDGTITGPLHPDNEGILIEELDTDRAPGVVEPYPQTSKREEEITETQNCFCQWFNS